MSALSQKAEALTALQDLPIDLYGDGVIPSSVRALN
ncbi:hypothetical protein SRABI128_01939 [Microbacterium sp. Bi128]|nr:hypothetical protein SRABI128_01939 [Microbacterium sp. Bi128]